MERTAPTSMVYSIPNILTYTRIVAVPALAFCFYLRGDKANWLALAIFVVAAITDFLDGYLARAWNQQSALGRMLDPIADKLIVSVALLMLAGSQVIWGWTLIAAIVILCREILVSGLREYLGQVQVSVPGIKLAKWKTTAQMVAIGFLLAGEAGDRIFPFTTQTGIVLLWLAALLTIYTGYEYFRAGLVHVINER